MPRYCCIQFTTRFQNNGKRCSSFLLPITYILPHHFRPGFRIHEFHCPNFSRVLFTTREKSLYNNILIVIVEEAQFDNPTVSGKLMTWECPLRTSPRYEHTYRISAP
jgi:hypothetical protein